MFDDLDVLNDLDQLRSRYEILGELGRDGGSVVHRARSRSGCEVAIKVMSTPDPAGPRPGARSVWQAHAVSPLRHPGLIDLHAVHHLQGGAVGLAMEHGQRQNLAERIRSGGPLPAEQAESVLRDLAGVLAFLHDRGVIHRAVRPESVFFDEGSGRALLAPFAIDRVEGERSGQAAARGALLRAFAYLAPEQIEGRAQVDSAAVSGQSDLYSLGLVGYAMLTGSQPWEGESLDAVLERKSAEALPPLDVLRPDLPGRVLRAIEVALEKKPARRWRSAQAFLSCLESDAGPAGLAPRIDWEGGLAGLRERTAALGSTIREYRIPAGVRRLPAAAIGMAAAVAAVAALTLLRPAPAPDVDRATPLVAVVPPAPESEPAAPGPIPEEPSPEMPFPVEALLPAPLPPAPGLAAEAPSRRAAGAAPRVTRRATAAPAASRASGAARRKSRVHLLGDPIPVEAAAARDRDRLPPLLGTPIPQGGARTEPGAGPRRPRGQSPG